MEKLNFIKEGALIRLPPGFRFHPTDEELVEHYLKRKVLSFPLPASIIPDLDVYKFDPWNLPGDLEQERYFFSTKEIKYRSDRATTSGYWKVTGIDKQIVNCKSKNQVVGIKKTLVFYRGKPRSASKTDFIMHEYRLTNVEIISKNSIQDNWVLCRIFLKKRTRNSSKRGACFRKNAPVLIDFMARNSRDLNSGHVSSSSGSSGITEVSRQETDDQEESSICNTFTNFRRKPLL